MEYKVKAITLKEKAEAAYRFLTCEKLYKRELTVFEDEDATPIPRPGFVFPGGLIKASYTNFADHDEFVSTIKKNKCRILGVASFTEDDANRVSIIAIPNEAAMEMGIDPGLLLNIYDSDISEEELNEFIDYLEGVSDDFVR